MQMYYFSRELPVIRISRLVRIAAGILLSLSVHNAGSSLLHMFFVFTLLNFLLYNPIKKIFTKEYLVSLGWVSLVVVCMYVGVYIVHSACTFFLETSFILPNKAFATLVTNIPYDQNQIFEGHLIGPDNFPNRYLVKYLYVTTPTVVLISFLLFFIFFKNAVKSLKPFSIFIFIYTLLFCINQVKTHYMNPDTLWAIHYCIYPLFMLVAASGVECTLRQIQDRYTNVVILGLLVFLSFMPIRHIVQNSPYTSLYFNEISGGIHNAYSKYALDSNFEANKEANTWIQKYIYQHDIYSHYVSRPVVVATNGNAACALFYQKDPHFSLVFKGFDRLDTTWDYYVAYCNQIPATQLRNGTWPPDSAIHLMTFEQKPMVAFYRNEARFREWNHQDSLARAADSLLAITDSLNLIESKKK
jgi:energy-converting hydrogenase Eha subunit C